jgi:putative alpha-1,2-mannosidase
MILAKKRNFLKQSKLNSQNSGLNGKNNSSTNKYNQTTKLNGKDLTKPFFTYKELVSGGK